MIEAPAADKPAPIHAIDANGNCEACHEGDVPEPSEADAMTQGERDERARALAGVDRMRVALSGPDQDFEPAQEHDGFEAFARDALQRSTSQSETAAVFPIEVRRWVDDAASMGRVLVAYRAKVTAMEAFAAELRATEGVGPFIAKEIEARLSATTAKPVEDAGSEGRARDDAADRSLRAFANANDRRRPIVNRDPSPPPTDLSIGSTWTGPDGTVYDVVRPEEVGERPRWWVVPEIARRLARSGTQWGPGSQDDLHMAPADPKATVACALVLAPVHVEAEMDALRKEVERLRELAEAAEARADRWETELGEAQGGALKLAAKIGTAEDEREALRLKLGETRAQLTSAQRACEASRKARERAEGELAAVRLALKPVGGVHAPLTESMVVGSIAKDVVQLRKRLAKLTAKPARKAKRMPRNAFDAAGNAKMLKPAKDKPRDKAKTIEWADIERTPARAKAKRKGVR